MAKILSFRSKQGAPSAQTFLTDETEKLSFSTGDDGIVSLDDMPENSLPGVMPDPQRDWTNQEIADLFRVRQLLSSAGVPVDTLRGISDEGDPWFVFCDLNGDVFIHMARIDGLYVLDSPNVARPLRGLNFNALVDDFTSGALPDTAKPGQEGSAARRVIRLERGGKLSLHPSAMLAALIWTLFLASDELVMMAPETPSDTDTLLDFSDIIARVAAAEVIETEMDSFDPTAQSEVLGSEETETQVAEGPMRETMVQQGIAMQQNAYAMGLSTIAIAMGFMSEAVLMDNQRKVLEGVHALAAIDVQNMVSAEAVDSDDEGSGALLAMLAEFLGLDLTLETETAEAQQLDGEEALLKAEADPMLAGPRSVASVPVVDDESDLAVAPVQDDAEPTQVASAQNAIQADVEAKPEAVEEIYTFSMDSFFDALSALDDGDAGETMLFVSFDVIESGSDGVSVQISVEDAITAPVEIETAPARTTNHREFDAQAQAFVDYINAKETEVGLIQYGNEIIMIDREAFERPGADTYTFSWETDEGQVISMIGLRAEFEQFDLIA